MTREYLDCSEDRFLAEDEIRKVSAGIDAEDFIESLTKFADSALDFGEAVNRSLGGVPEGVRKIVLECLQREER